MKNNLRNLLIDKIINHIEQEVKETPNGRFENKKQYKNYLKNLKTQLEDEYDYIFYNKHSLLTRNRIYIACNYCGKMLRDKNIEKNNDDIIINSENIENENLIVKCSCSGYHNNIKIPSLKNLVPIGGTSGNLEVARQINQNREDFIKENYSSEAIISDRAKEKLIQ